MTREKSRTGKNVARPLWGEGWKGKDFWDALMVVRAKIRTASAALADSGLEDSVGLTLDDTAEELMRLVVAAQGRSNRR